MNPIIQPATKDDESFLSISDAFLEKLITEIDDDTIRGIVLGGSHARGNPTPYSDIDLACFFSYAE